MKSVCARIICLGPTALFALTNSIDKAADELVDALQIHRQAHPETKYWLLTNFPNWGYRGDVSYHARGSQRQDYGDYDQVVRIVLNKPTCTTPTLPTSATMLRYSLLCGLLQASSVTS